MKKILFLLVLVLVSCTSHKNTVRTDYIPSMNNQGAKSEILAFVEKATQSGKLFIPEEERIALIKLNGVLLPTKPEELMDEFMFYSIDKLSQKDTELAPQSPYKEIAQRDPAFCSTFDKNKYYHLYSNVYNDMTPDSFALEVDKFLYPSKKSSHVKYYKAVEEIINYLHINKFNVYLYGNFDREFVARFSDKMFGVPAINVLGREPFFRFDTTSNKLKMPMKSSPYFVKSPDGVPFIRQKLLTTPLLLIAGDSSDYHIMKYTQTNPMGALILYINHNDPTRDYSDEPATAILKRDGEINGWIEIKTKEDFNKMIK
jgi:hypothetical protein